MKKANMNLLSLQGLDGSLIMLSDVDGFCQFGDNGVFVQFMNQTHKFYNNFNVIKTKIFSGVKYLQRKLSLTQDFNEIKRSFEWIRECEGLTSLQMFHLGFHCADDWMIEVAIEER